jgi:hypothetical protein
VYAYGCRRLPGVKDLMCGAPRQSTGVYRTMKSSKRLTGKFGHRLLRVVERDEPGTRS